MAALPGVSLALPFQQDTKTRHTRGSLVVIMPIGSGEKSLLNLSEQPQQHAIGRKPLSEALSPKAVLELQPNVNAILEKLILRLEGFAKSGEVGVRFCSPVLVVIFGVHFAESSCNLCRHIAFKGIG